MAVNWLKLAGDRNTSRDRWTVMRPDDDNSTGRHAVEHGTARVPRSELQVGVRCSGEGVADDKEGDVF